jgi:hypothetical protein
MEQQLAYVCAKSPLQIPALLREEVVDHKRRSEVHMDPVPSEREVAQIVGAVLDGKKLMVTFTTSTDGTM